MKINVKKLCLFVTLSTTAGLWTPERSQAQEPNLNRRTEAVGRAIQSMQQIQGGRELSPNQNNPLLDPWYSSGPRNSVSRSGSGTIRKAAEAVRDAKGDEAKSAAQKKLTDLLNKSYDEDMAQRERELKQIEERLTKLRELLSRRRSKKQEIIDLQIKVALNDADGLGFYENERPAKSTINPYNYAPVQPVPQLGELNPPAPRAHSSSSSSVGAPTGLPSVGPSPDSTPSVDSQPLTPEPSR